MSDFFFVLKSLVLTVGVVFLLQMRVGEKTLETHSMNWLHQSSAVDVLQSVAEGAAKALREGAHQAKQLVNRHTGAAFAESVPARASAFVPAAVSVSGSASGSGPGADSESESSRFDTFKLRRSEAYHREQEQKRRESR